VRLREGRAREAELRAAAGTNPAPA
jgi:hypothetical protein